MHAAAKHSAGESVQQRPKHKLRSLSGTRQELGLLFLRCRVYSGPWTFSRSAHGKEKNRRGHREDNGIASDRLHLIRKLLCPLLAYSNVSSVCPTSCFSVYLVIGLVLLWPFMSLVKQPVKLHDYFHLGILVIRVTKITGILCGPHRRFRNTSTRRKSMNFEF